MAKLLPGRTDDQCAKRWRENLDPSISRRPWTDEEDEILMDRYESLGKRWKQIASCFEGRPPVHCRNRVQSLIRAKRRALKAERAGKSKGKRPVQNTRNPTDSIKDEGAPWDELLKSSHSILDVRTSAFRLSCHVH